MTQPHFATGYIRVLYRYMRSEGIHNHDLFAGTGVNEVDLMTSTLNMPFSAQMRFCRNAVDLSPPGLGLRAGSQLQLAAHGSLGTAMQTSAKLGTALEVFSRFLNGRASFYSTRLDMLDEASEFLVEVNGLQDSLVPFFTETILHSIFHCISYFFLSPRNQPDKGPDQIRCSRICRGLSRDIRACGVRSRPHFPEDTPLPS